jgi:succinate-semialdehyde dehydrogenase/glutarate-semialdehyde dehydrogenase
LCGGSRIDGPGCFYEPTVLGRLAADGNLVTEEIFGPVTPVLTFTSEEGAIAAANCTEYGLASYVYTATFPPFRVMESLETGMIGLNQGMVSNTDAPCGGVRHFGLGREGDSEVSRTTWRRSKWPCPSE